MECKDRVIVECWVGMYKMEGHLDQPRKMELVNHKVAMKVVNSDHRVLGSVALMNQMGNTQCASLNSISLQF